jgi:hypothetical protein
MNTAQDIDLKKEVQGIRTAAVKSLIVSAAYRGYPQGAVARAFGMVTTVIPTLVILAISLVALARNWIAP